MSDIANHVGISKRTLYEVFKDKEELLGHCIDLHQEKVDCEWKTQKSGNVIETMMLIYAKTLNEAHGTNKFLIHDLKKYHPSIYKKVEERQKEGIASFLPLLEKGIAEGLIRNDVNSEIVIWLLKSQFKALMESDFVPIDKFSINEFVRAIILNFTRGIATDKGRQLIDVLIDEISKQKENI